jgi:hypothetical protein
MESWKELGMTYLIQAITLVDITDSGVSRVRDSNTIEYHQQQNLNVLLQTIGMRTQPIDPYVSILEVQTLTDFNFSDFYGVDAHNVWRLTFYVDDPAVFSDSIDTFALLKDDAHGIAITPDLMNTIDFPVDIFDTTDNINLYFR